MTTQSAVMLSYYLLKHMENKNPYTSIRDNTEILDLFKGYYTNEQN